MDADQVRDIVIELADKIECELSSSLNIVERSILRRAVEYIKKEIRNEKYTPIIEKVVKDLYESYSGSGCCPLCGSKKKKKKR